MRGQAGPWLVDQIISIVFDTDPYAGLHTGVPNPDDPTATEVVGAWYSRKPFVWAELDGSSLANDAPLNWGKTPGVTLAGVAIYRASTGPDMISWVPYTTPLVIPAGKAFSIAAEALYIEIG